MRREGSAAGSGGHAPPDGAGVSSCREQAHPHRFGRDLRLRENWQYQQVYRRGRAFHSRNLTLVYMKSRDQKAGFSVSTKVGNSVVRNRLRRRMKENYRLIRPQLGRGRAIFIARISAAQATSQALCGDMQALLRKAGLLRDRP